MSISQARRSWKKCGSKQINMICATKDMAEWKIHIKKQHSVVSSYNQKMGRKALKKMQTN